MRILKLLFCTVVLTIQFKLAAALPGTLVLPDSLHLARLAAFTDAWSVLRERKELNDMVVMLKIDQDEWNLYSKEYKAIYAKTERLSKFREGDRMPLVYIDEKGGEHRAALFEISVIGIVLDQAEVTSGLYLSLIEEKPPGNIYMWFHVSRAEHRKWRIERRLPITGDEYIEIAGRSRMFDIHSFNQFESK